MVREKFNETTVMKDFILFIIKHILDNPGAVRANEIDGEQTVVFALRVGTR